MGEAPAVFRNSVAMERFTGADRAFCLGAFHRNNDSATIARRKFREYPKLRTFNDYTTVQTIKNWVQKFEDTGSTLVKQRSGRPRTRTEEIIDIVQESVRKNPTQSIRKHSSALTMPRSTLPRILKKDKKFHTYKIQLVQELKATDPTNRLNFVNEMMNNLSSFKQRVIF